MAAINERLIGVHDVTIKSFYFSSPISSSNPISNPTLCFSPFNTVPIPSRIYANASGFSVSSPRQHWIWAWLSHVRYIPKYKFLLTNFYRIISRSNVVFLIRVEKKKQSLNKNWINFPKFRADALFSPESMFNSGIKSGQSENRILELCAIIIIALKFTFYIKGVITRVLKFIIAHPR